MWRKFLKKGKRVAMRYGEKWYPAEIVDELETEKLRLTIHQFRDHFQILERGSLEIQPLGKKFPLTRDNSMDAKAESASAEADLWQRACYQVTGAGTAEVNGIYKPRPEKKLRAPAWDMVKTLGGIEMTFTICRARNEQMRMCWFLSRTDLRKDIDFYESECDENSEIPGTGEWEENQGKLPIPYVTPMDISKANEAKVDSVSTLQRALELRQCFNVLIPAVHEIAWKLWEQSEGLRKFRGKMRLLKEGKIVVLPKECLADSIGEASNRVTTKVAELRRSVNDDDLIEEMYDCADKRDAMFEAIQAPMRKAIESYDQTLKLSGNNAKALLALGKNISTLSSKIFELTKGIRVTIVNNIVEACGEADIDSMWTQFLKKKFVWDARSSMRYHEAYSLFESAFHCETKARSTLPTLLGIKITDGCAKKILEDSFDTHARATQKLAEATRTLIDVQNDIGSIFLKIMHLECEVAEKSLKESRNIIGECRELMNTKRGAVERECQGIQDRLTHVKRVLEARKRAEEYQVIFEENQRKKKKLKHQIKEISETIHYKLRRRQKVNALRGELHNLRDELRKLCTDPNSILAASKLLEITWIRPELAFLLEGLDPFHGTAAQGTRVRSIDEYDQVKSLSTCIGNEKVQGHNIFTALCDFKTPELKKTPCILKSFDGGSSLKPLRRAAHVMAKLCHPNIISLQAICRDEEKGRWLLQLPRYRYDLHQWMIDEKNETKGVGDQTDKEAWSSRCSRILKGVLEGIYHLHHMDVVHRDVKPQNILIGPPMETEEGKALKDSRAPISEYAVICDFETCKLNDGSLGTMATTKVTLGTQGYQDPEAAFNGVTSASDMYAFGVTMGELLTGKRLRSPKDVDDSEEHLSDEEYDILRMLLQKNQANRPSAWNVLQMPYFSEGPEVLRKCVLCFDDVNVGKGVICKHPHTRHFICDECFGRFVDSQAREEIRLQLRREARVKCPMVLGDEKAGHCGVPFDDLVIAEHVSQQTFDRYLASKAKVSEVRLVAEVEARAQQQLQVELKKLRKMEEKQRRIYQARKYILHEIFPNKCPRCGTAFQDFNNCFAVTCHRCPCHFCAWCLRDCGDDAHYHVLRCRENTAGGNLFASADAFHLAMNRRRVRQIRSHLVKLGSIAKEVIEGLVDECEKDENFKVMYPGLNLQELVSQISGVSPWLHREADGVA